MLVVVVQPVLATLPVAVVEVGRIQAFTEAQQRWQSLPVVEVVVVAVTPPVTPVGLVGLVAVQLVLLVQHLVPVVAVVLAPNQLAAQVVPVGQMPVRQVAH